MTPNLKVIHNYIKTLPEYEHVNRVGITNCRRIGSGQTYSQHSWSNALDIHFTSSFSIPATGAALAAGNRMRDKLREAFDDDLYELIWQAPSHWEHIHVSTYPRGWLTPPCAGGAQRIRFRDGTVQDAPFPLTIKEEDMVSRSDKADEGVVSLKPNFDEMVNLGVMSRFTQPGGVTFNDELATFLVRFEDQLLSKVANMIAAADGEDGLTAAQVKNLIRAARLTI